MQKGLAKIQVIPCLNRNRLTKEIEFERKNILGARIKTSKAEISPNDKLKTFPLAKYRMKI